MSTSSSTDQTAFNSLGLDLEALKIKDDLESTDSKASVKDAASTADNESSVAEEATDTNGEGDGKDEAAGKKESKEKKKPYVNPDRVKTGGAQREKPSDEELVERMARIREQNEKIKQRRLDVQADEDEYKKTQAVERAKMARAKKVQENVDKTREQNARRKMDKIQSREWDSGKPAREWNKPKPTEAAEDGDKKPQQSVGIRGAVRGGGRGGSTRGRGRGGIVTSPTTSANKEAIPPVAETPAPVETVTAS